MEAAEKANWDPENKKWVWFENILKDIIKSIWLPYYLLFILWFRGLVSVVLYCTCIVEA